MNNKSIYIDLAKKAMMEVPEHDPDRASFMALLGSDIFEQWEVVGLDEDLKDSLSYMEQAVAAIPEDDPFRPKQLANLGSVLASRFEQTDDLDTLEMAISKTKEAISAISKSDTDYGGMLRHLANMYFRKYERTGNQDALQYAVLQLDEALSMTPHDHPARAGLLSTQGAIMFGQYDLTGNTDDLHAAVSCATEGLALMAEDDPHYKGRLGNFGSLLTARYERTRSLVDLDIAIDNTRRLIAGLDRTHYRYRHFLNNLAAQLGHRYEHTNSLDDLEEAIEKAQDAASLTTEDHAYLPIILNNLGLKLAARYKHTKNIRDLEASLSTFNQTVSALPDGHPKKAGALFNLGNQYLSRYRNKDLGHEAGDLVHALFKFDEAAKSPTAKPLTRVMSARKAFRVVLITEEWSWAAKFAQDAIDLLPIVCSRHLNREDQQRAIAQGYGLAADACSVSLLAGNVEQALQQVEFGRGLILSYMIDSHSDASILLNDYPNLATKFKELQHRVSRSVIEATTHSPAEETAHKRMEDTILFEECLNEIRQKKGYERFLLQPSLDELQGGAAEGPIVIVNVTDISSDAIIVSKSGLSTIKLPEMNAARTTVLLPDLRLWEAINEPCRSLDRELPESRFKRNLDEKSSLLSWLWKTCVGPVLQEVKRLPEISSSVEKPRIWWIGTGVASSLPFHAAGNYGKDSNENALSQVISSYTPTIRSLIHARLCASGLTGSPDEKQSVLLVAMPETPGAESLPGVKEEISVIQQTLGDSFSVKTLQYPSAREVIREMKEANIVHFACHGFSDYVNPSDSHLLLQCQGPSGPCVEKLRLQLISDEQSSSKTQIAYLSACSTAEVKAKLYADEGLHIVSAFQVAGFGHVIGSLWAADDRTCVHVARYFYEYLTKEKHGIVTSRAVAEALQTAILRIRPGRDAKQWAPFIHSGA